LEGGADRAAIERLELKKRCAQARRFSIFRSAFVFEENGAR
jgi:ribosomal protein L33